MSAKAITQQGRASGKVASTVTLTESMSNVEEGEHFLESQEQTALSVNAK